MIDSVGGDLGVLLTPLIPPPGQDSPTRSLISLSPQEFQLAGSVGGDLGITDPSDPSPWAGLPILHLMFGWGTQHFCQLLDKASLVSLMGTLLGACPRTHTRQDRLEVLCLGWCHNSTI